MVVKGFTGVSQVVELATTSKEFIVDALKSCPPASLAWAGVCLIVLPVSFPRNMLWMSVKHLIGRIH